MDPVEQFAKEAAIFEQWARGAAGSGEEAVHEALIRLLQLYLVGLTLPSASSDRLSEDMRVSDEEWRVVHASCARLPLDLYGEVFNPLDLPPLTPVVGSIADDIADIYRDVVTGLRAFRAGLKAEAAWHWRFHFQIHWGEHVTGAIRALHCWLVATRNAR